jgi:hypothetical protein
LTKFRFRKEAAFTASFRGTERSSIFSHLVLQFLFCINKRTAGVVPFAGAGILFSDGDFHQEAFGTAC